jgi:hypothetical protein
MGRPKPSNISAPPSPDCDPDCNWTNFSFIADDVTVSEVDALVVTPRCLFLIEIKSDEGELFIAAMESCSVRDAALRLREWFALGADQSPSALVSARPTAPDQFSPVAGETNKPLAFELSRLDQAHPYLKGRGVAPDTARYFGGRHRGKGLMEGRVVIPIHDEHGFLVACAGRSIDAMEPKYRFPSRF